MSSKTTTWAIEFQDKITSGLAKAQNSSNSLAAAFGAAAARVVNFGTHTKTLNTSVTSLSNRISQLKAQRDILPMSEIGKIRKFNSEIAGLEKQMGKMQTLNGGWFKSKFSEAIGSLPGAGFITNPLVALGAGLSVSIKKGMENELAKTNIVTLMQGDEAGADKLFNQISEYGKNTVYDKGSLIDAQKTMMSFGLDAEKSFNTLQQIGDIAMGDAGKMQSLSLAFAQASSTGKLMGQDLMQMINAGFNPLQTISDKTGESMEDLKKRMSEGKISADELSQAFQWATEEGGLFYQGAEKAGQTLSGRMNKMMDSLSEMAISLYAAIEPILSPLVNLTTSIFDGLGSSITWIIDKFKEGNPIIMGLAGAIGGLTLAIGVYKGVVAIAAAVQNGFGLAVIASNLALLANPIVLIVGLVAGLIVAVVACWNKFEGFREVIYGVWEAIKGFGNILKEFVLDRIKGIISGLGAIGSAIAKLFKGDFKGAWTDAKSGLADLSGVNAVKSAFESGKKLGDAYQEGAAKGRVSFQADQEKKASQSVGAKSIIGNEGVNKTVVNPFNATNNNSKNTIFGLSGGSSSGKSITMNVTLNITNNGIKNPDEFTEQIIRKINDKLSDTLAQAG